MGNINTILKVETKKRGEGREVTVIRGRFFREGLRVISLHNN